VHSWIVIYVCMYVCDSDICMYAAYILCAWKILFIDVVFDQMLELTDLFQMLELTDLFHLLPSICLFLCAEEQSKQILSYILLHTYTRTFYFILIHTTSYLYILLHTYTWSASYYFILILSGYDCLTIRYIVMLLRLEDKFIYIYSYMYM
jgi:hypothetical protein